MTCAWCHRTALYRVGDVGACGNHRHMAIDAQVAEAHRRDAGRGLIERDTVRRHDKKDTAHLYRVTGVRTRAGHARETRLYEGRIDVFQPEGSGRSGRARPLALKGSILGL